MMTWDNAIHFGTGLAMVLLALVLPWGIGAVLLNAAFWIGREWEQANAGSISIVWPWSWSMHRHLEWACGAGAGLLAWSVWFVVMRAWVL